MSNQNLILGIDPGYDRLGWAIAIPSSSTIEVVDLGCISPPKNKNIEQRYTEIIKSLKKILKRHQVKELAIESIFFSKNTKTAIKVSELRGVVIGLALDEGLNVFNYNPNQIKLVVTGDGSADKKAVEKMLKLQVELPEGKMVDDAIDAAAICLTHSLSRRSSN